MTEQMNVPKLRFGGFSGGLLVTRLSEIINKLESGVSVNSEDVPPNSNENGVLKTSAIYAGSFNPEQAKVITDSSELQRARLNPKKDSIIISRMNTPALVGESGYISKDYPNLFIPDRLWQATVSSQHCARWLSFLLTSPRTRFIISSKGTGTSNSMKNISKPSFLSIDAVTPTLPEQQKIASFLSKVDEKIGLLSEKKDKLTEYKRGVMQQLFNGKWHEQDGQLTFVPPTLRFKADDGCEFPDWEEKTLGDVSNHITYGLTVRPNFVENGIPLISAREITSGVPMYNKAPMISSETFDKLSSKAKPQVGDIFLSKTGTIGFSAMHTLSSKVAITQNIAVIRITEPNLVSADYVLHYLKTTSFLKSAIARVNQSTIMDLQLGDIKKLRLPLPSSVAEQQKVAQFISKIDQKIGLATTELETTKEWKKGLLQQMFV